MKFLSRNSIGLFILLGLVFASCAQAALVVSNDPAYDLNSFVVVGLQVANYILGIVGALTLLMFIYGGFTWILSGGSSDKVQKGKDIILGAVVGLVIVFSSYMIVSYVTNNIFQAKNSKGGNLFTGSAPESAISGTPCKAAGGSCTTGTACSNLRLKVEKSECRQNYVCCGTQAPCTATAGQKCADACSSTEVKVTGACAESGKVCCKEVPACYTVGGCMPSAMCPPSKISNGYSGCASGEVCCLN